MSARHSRVFHSSLIRDLDGRQSVSERVSMICGTAFTHIELLHFSWRLSMLLYPLLYGPS